MKVWAPNAKQVEVELTDTGERLRMRPEADGFFAIASSAVVGPYQLRLDEGSPIPDPRAEDVASVHGPCFLVDHSHFEWTDGAHTPAGLQGAVLYELHVGTFTPEGTFDAAASRLGALKDLGITHVELMPVATFSGQHGWGYDGTALFAPHRAYGGVDGLKRFVNAAHSHGLSVLLDVVYNHLGPVGNYLSQFGPYFHPDLRTPWGGAVVNLDGPGCAQVRRFFLDNALAWLRNYHLDGLRLDAIQALVDRSPTHLLKQLAVEVEAAGLPALLIAESDLNDPIVVRSRADHGYGLDAQWSDELHHALRVALTGEAHGYYVDFQPRPLTALARALEEGFVFQGQHSTFRNGPHGKPLGDVPLNRLLGYAQTHDQVGNDAGGRRLAQVAGLARAKAALALVMVSPFTPMLFMGEEWAASSPFLYFTDHADPEVARSTFDGRRRELAERGDPGEVADPQDPRTFARSKLAWDERSRSSHREMLSFTRALIALRRSSPQLIGSQPGRCTVDEERQTLLFRRGDFLVALNLGLPGEIPLPVGAWRMLLQTGAGLTSSAVTLGADGLAILGISASSGV